MIVTFYSFKGGVGRSMALANVAEMLADAGYRVVVCDFDLEAPGLERYFFDQAAQSQAWKSKPGIIDLLDKYKRSLIQSPANARDSSELPSLDSPSKYAVRVDEKRRETGSIRLLTAGMRASPVDTSGPGPAEMSYERRVQDFAWSDFYDQWAGGAYLEFFRQDLLSEADIVLIDSRTGVTEHGGVCTHHLADLVVLLSAPNDLNLEGALWMAESLSRPELVKLRNDRPILVLPVAARVEQTSQKEELADFQHRFSESFSRYVAKEVGSSTEFLRTSEIPYIGYYAFRERVVARESEEKRHRGLHQAYASLTRGIVNVGVKTKQLEPPKHGPLSRGPMKVFLSYSIKDSDFVERLAAAMTAKGFEPWRREVEIETGANFVAKINEGMAQSDVALLVWSPDAAKSAWIGHEWSSLLVRQVEEQRIRLGIIRLREHPLPPLLATKDYIDARASYDAGIHATLEWLELRRRVQRFSGLKAPIYLPDYQPKDFVGRREYLARLRDTLTAQGGGVSALRRARRGEIHAGAAFCLGGAKGLRRGHLPDLRPALAGCDYSGTCRPVADRC